MCKGGTGGWFECLCPSIFLFDQLRTGIWNHTSITVSPFFEVFFLFLSLAGSFPFSSWENVRSRPIRCSFL
uniref:Uncharacterized protein n=1 Tax=Arundo donax TaxID=35708 RepID=A0A0A8Z0Z2_ARUDO